MCYKCYDSKFYQECCESLWHMCFRCDFVICYMFLYGCSQPCFMDVFYISWAMMLKMELVEQMNVFVYVC